MEVNMLKIMPLEKIDAVCIVKWNDKKTSDFLLQWAGRGYEYPISEKQISDRIEVESSSRDASTKSTNAWSTNLVKPSSKR